MDCRAGGAVVWKFTLPGDQVSPARDIEVRSGVPRQGQGVSPARDRGCPPPGTGGVPRQGHKPPNEPSNEPLNEPPKQNTGCTPKPKAQLASDG